MSSSSRQESSTVATSLLEQTTRFSFIQAVRLLERCYAYTENDAVNIKNNTIARYTPPDVENIRFHTNQKLEFFASDIKSIHKNSNNKQWHLNVNLMGLTGAAGILPYHYSELILQRLKVKDPSLQNFFDLFNHRTISLYFQASVKYKLPLEYERKRLSSNNKDIDLYTNALLSLIGLGTKHTNKRLFTQDESLIYYSGLFSQQIKTTENLKQILQRHFSVPVKIREFVGQWQELIDDVRTRLSSKALPKGQNARLSQSAIIGKKGWFAQGKIHIVIGPLNTEQLKRFAPGTTTLKALNQLVRLYAGIECNYDFVIQVKRKDIPQNLVLDKKTRPIIGWNTFLPKSNYTYNQEETTDIVISAARLQ